MFLLQDAEGAHVCPRISPSLIGEVWDESGFLAMAGQWRELHSRTAHPSPFTSWNWAWAWWRHFGVAPQDQKSLATARPSSSRQLRVVTVHDRHGLLLAVAPFYRSVPSSPLLSCEMRLLGDDGRDGEGMTDEPILLLRSGYEAEATRALLRHLLAERRHDDWDFLKVRLPQAVSFGTSEVTELFPDTPSCRVRHEEGPQVVTLPESWPCFRQTLSRSMRDNLAYYPRRLTRHGHLWRVDLVREPGKICRAVDVLVDLHNRRARCTRGVAHLSHIPGERQAAFLRECLPALAADGMAMVALLEVDGRPVAAQAFLEAGDGTTGRREMVMYYSGFDADWYDYSPVTLLGAAAIEEAACRGVARLNFLPGAMSWKERWGTQRQGSIADVRCLRPRAAALARVFCRSTHRRLTAFAAAYSGRHEEEKDWPTSKGQA